MKMKKSILSIAVIFALLATCFVFCACNSAPDDHVEPPAPEYFSVKFYVLGEEGGQIKGKVKQKVVKGGSTQVITAIADEGYYFAGWIDENLPYSDNEYMLREDRVIENVVEDLTFTAVFYRKTFTVTYDCDGNGYINGSVVQSVKYGDDTIAVTAVPDHGFMFDEWSDGVKTAERNETELSSNKSIKAKFVPFSKTFKYNYKFADGNCQDADVTLTYGQLDNAKLTAPTREHADFGGWYTDRYLTECFADEDGNVIADDEALYKDGNTLYSKWIGENTHPYKILIVYVTEIDAPLAYRYSGEKVQVHYVMTQTEREICHLITQKIAFELNDLAIADFVVDEYFTTEPIGEKSIKSEGPKNKYCNHIFAYDIPEVKEKCLSYDSVLSSFSFNDYIGRFRYDSGVGPAKYGCVHFEDSVAQALLDKWTLDDITNPDFMGWDLILDHYFHELAHTIEQRVNGFFDYHTVVRECWDYRRVSFYETQLYFLKKAIIDGEAVGIPYEFWEGKVARVFYEATEGGMVYKGLAILNSEVRYEDEIQYVMYGQDAARVEAVAKYGYEFVGWSDGVTAIERQDKNVTGDIYIVAIFKPINSE